MMRLYSGGHELMRIDVHGEYQIHKYYKFATIITISALKWQIVQNATCLQGKKIAVVKSYNLRFNLQYVESEDFDYIRVHCSVSNITPTAILKKANQQRSIPTAVSSKAVSCRAATTKKQ